MMLMVCSVILASGIWTCSDPMPLNDAISTVIASNETFPYKAGDARGPNTLFREYPKNQLGNPAR